MEHGYSKGALEKVLPVSTRADDPRLGVSLLTADFAA